LQSRLPVVVRLTREVWRTRSRRKKEKRHPKEKLEKLEREKKEERLVRKPRQPRSRTPKLLPTLEHTTKERPSRQAAASYSDDPFKWRVDMDCRRDGLGV
jgi:hypothetical protein